MIGMHTVIIGGGLGGLCLAQGLLKSGLSVAVYERDTSAHIRGQGYRIGIKDAGCAALRDCLPAILDTFLVTVTSARPVPPWQVPNVTLLGDAIHTMSPGRGEGANVALRDAALLCRTLAAGERKEQYEKQMMHYAFHAVAESRDKPFLRGKRQQDRGSTSSGHH